LRFVNRFRLFGCKTWPVRPQALQRGGAPDHLPPAAPKRAERLERPPMPASRPRRAALPRLAALPRFAVAAPLLAVALLLAGCDSDAERAEKHYQRALTLLADGDSERAAIEFRTVFRLDPTHVQARQRYAALRRDAGALRQAYGQYRLLVEQDPGNAELHRELADVALELQEFDVAETHAARAVALDPADPMARALKATVDFRKGPGPDRDAAVAMARGVLADAPDTVAAHMVLIADRLEAGAPEAALPLIETALQVEPEDRGLHLTRLATLERLGDLEGAGAALRDMTARFPDDADMRTALVRWHLRMGDPDSAEAVLRAAAARDPADSDAGLAVARFLYERSGSEAARAELAARASSAPARAPYQRALAELDFAEGRRTEAIDGLRALLEDAEDTPDTRELQVALAAMLAETGAATGAADESAALVESVLAADPANVAALKLRARAAIDADRAQDAITDLRLALGAAPRDAEILTIMALAYERDGARELMGERLALAAEVSGAAPAESLRYASFLMQEDRPGPAEAAVTAALERVPEHPALLEMLGRIHLARGDWPRADQVAGLLRGLGDPSAAAMADALEAEGLRGRGRPDDALALLEGLAGQGADAAAMAELVRRRVEAGEPEAAQSYLEGVLAAEPDNLPAQLLLAGVEAIAGDAASAGARYRAVIAATPQLADAYQALATLQAGQGDTEAAAATLEAGLAAGADPAQLRFARAGLREARGDIAGAIDDYAVLYARDSASTVVANNLASLLSASGETQDIDRAFAIARRLRDTEQPHFQDTYGWILHLRGASSRALDYLVPASEALPGMAQVWLHRGEAELALGRAIEARASFTRALEAAEAGSPLPEAAALRERMSELDPDPDLGADPADPAHEG
jgi:predicted Zn-dependent protease